jgi:hypothetical protein
MRRSWRAYLAAACVALGWFGIEFVILPRLADPVSFNKVSGTTEPAAAGSPVQNFRGNVYHIIFDGYQSEAYQYFLDKTPELNQLPLTYYPNFRANSSMTYFSTAELFTGNFYTVDMSPEDWHNAAFQSLGMMKYLANGGVRLHLYPFYPEFCYGGGSAQCKIASDLTKGVTDGSRARQTVVDLWFLKLIPGSLKRGLNAWFGPKAEDASDDSSFSNWDYGFSISNAISPSKAVPDADKAYFSLQQFMQFLSDEDSRPATGQYVFVHAMLPHGPSVLDRECTYLQQPFGQDQAEQQPQYLDQVQCANKLMALLVNKLEKLGRLDKSLIIFQADHGYYWHPADLGVLHEYNPLDVSVPRVTHDKGDSSKWPSEMIETRASALLLIKFPGQAAPSRSDKPAQMIDIAPTILRYFDFDSGLMRGIPIQDMPESPARDRFFFAANFIPTQHSPALFSRYRYVDGKWKFEENITTPLTKVFSLGPTRDNLKKP